MIDMEKWHRMADKLNEVFYELTNANSELDAKTKEIDALRKENAELKELVDLYRGDNDD